MLRKSQKQIKSTIRCQVLTKEFVIKKQTYTILYHTLTYTDILIISYYTPIT
jgi:hypothetical protein